MKASALKPMRMTSRAKKAPASGALKAEAMPAAVPAAARWRIEDRRSRSPRPMMLAADAPSSAIGPSGPTEPPPPIVSAADVVAARAGRGAMVPSPWRVDQMTPATPWPVGVRPSRDINGPVSSPESTGVTRTNQVPRGARSPTEGPIDTV